MRKYSVHVASFSRDDDIVSSAPTMSQIDIQCAISHTIWLLSLPHPSVGDCKEVDADGVLTLTSCVEAL